MALMFIKTEVTRGLRGSPCPPRGAYHIIQTVKVCVCGGGGMVRVCVPKFARRATARRRVYSPITRTVPELQLANLQCSRRPQKGPRRGSLMFPDSPYPRAAPRGAPFHVSNVR